MRRECVKLLWHTLVILSICYSTLIEVCKRKNLLLMKPFCPFLLLLHYNFVILKPDIANNEHYY